MNRFSPRLLALLGILAIQSVSAIDNPHFYRATNMFSEPRFERNGLTSFDFTLGGGKTHTGFNGENCKAPILDVWGTHNMRLLGVGVPCKDPNNCLDLILIELAKEDQNNGFGAFSLCSQFKIFEANLSFEQNFARGLFFQAHLPVRKLELNDTCFRDLSPADEECFGCPNINTPIWQTFLQHFDEILDRWCLHCDPFDEWGIGDTSLLLGWTHNYQETNVIDFVDMTFKAGILIPTGKTKNENQIFSLPFGYNGHWAGQGIGKISFGLYDWITFGGHIEAMFFANKDRNIRLQTAPCQSALIKLAKGEAKISPGTIWDAGVYAKADHVVGGLSILMGYSFASKNEDTITPCDMGTFNPCVANGDQFYESWKMNTLHVQADYDFYQPNRFFGPRVGFFYNYIISGKHIFRTNMLGGIIGLDITHDF